MIMSDSVFEKKKKKKKVNHVECLHKESIVYSFCPKCGCHSVDYPYQVMISGCKMYVSGEQQVASQLTI